MRVHTFVNDPQALLEQGQKIVSSSSDAKYIYRVTLVNLLLTRKMAAAELSTLSGVPERTLSSWLKTEDEDGFEHLKAIKQDGRPRRLSTEQTAEIKEAICKDASEYGYTVWDGPTLSSYIKKQYNVDLGVRQCQRLFHELGFSLIRPQAYASLGEKNTGERENVKKTDQPYAK